VALYCVIVMTETLPQLEAERMAGSDCVREWVDDVENFLFDFHDAALAQRAVDVFLPDPRCGVICNQLSVLKVLPA